MKKKLFFILLIILIIIIFYYNNYYEHFSVKVQDAMIFKDYNDNLIGTYPDNNIYPDLFIKSNGEYINMIGTVHGVTEIKMSKPKDGRKGPKGDKGKQGKRGMQGPRGKHGKELVIEDIEGSRNSTCIAPGGTVLSRMCKGSDGINPEKPPDGNPGLKCPHKGGKCPEGLTGEAGKTCKQLIGHDTCPKGKTGEKGLTCKQVNDGLEIIDNKCPDGDQGEPGETCFQRFGHIDGICPKHLDANDGQTCFQKFGGTLPQCIESTPGVDSVNCMNSIDQNVKICGVNNPDKVNDVAKSLIINEYDGNTLTIDNNNKDIILNGNIELPENGKIIFKDENNEIVEIIDKSYIDNMISKSEKCKKCPPINGKTRWNNSDNCKKNQGSCQECSECPFGFRESLPCGENNNAEFEECNLGEVGIGCHEKCDAKNAKKPNYNNSACEEIANNKYLTSNYESRDIPPDYYRNPNDATLIIPCKNCPSGQYSTGGCSGTQNRICTPCTNCPSGQYMYGGCSGSQNTNCSNCTTQTSYNQSAKQQGIDWNGSGETQCGHNCKVDFYDNTLRGNDWDVYGKASNGWWIRGSKASGAIYWDSSYSGSNITVSGNNLYFWQWTNGNNKWKFNVINNHKKYNSGNNRQTYCNTCTGHNRSLGGNCTSFDDYKNKRLAYGL